MGTPDQQFAHFAQMNRWKHEAKLARDYEKHVRACNRKGLEPSSLDDFKVTWQILNGAL